jgi:hypothetical protein
VISDDHSAKLVSKDEPAQSVNNGDDDDDDDEEEEDSLAKYERLHTFSVKQTKEEEESAVATRGFSVNVPFGLIFALLISVSALSFSDAERYDVAA